MNSSYYVGSFNFLLLSFSLHSINGFSTSLAKCFKELLNFNIFYVIL